MKCERGQGGRVWLLVPIPVKCRIMDVVAVMVVIGCSGSDGLGYMLPTSNMSSSDLDMICS